MWFWKRKRDEVVRAKVEQLAEWEKLTKEFEDRFDEVIGPDRSVTKRHHIVEFKCEDSEQEAEDITLQN